MFLLLIPRSWSIPRKQEQHCSFKYLRNHWHNGNWSKVVVIFSTATFVKRKTSAIFHLLGTCPDCEDKLIMYARGPAISEETSLRSPGGKLSIPVALCCFNFFNSRSTNSFDTYPNWKVSLVLCSFHCYFDWINCIKKASIWLKSILLFKFYYSLDR